MKSTRLEAFSDGVFAIIITLMAIDLKPPHDEGFQALLQTWPTALAFLLSFLHVGLYWNNHHHLFFAIHKIDGKVMWANLLYLFTLSLVPFVTDWMGENEFARNPVILYGLVMVANALAYTVLNKALIQVDGQSRFLAEINQRQRKETLSLLLYAAAVGLAFVNQYISLALYAVNVLRWVVPDKRIEERADVIEERHSEMEEQ